MLCGYCAGADNCHCCMQDIAPGAMLQSPDCEPHCTHQQADQDSAGQGLTFMLVAHDNCCWLAPVDGANVSAGCVQVGHKNL